MAVPKAVQAQVEAAEQLQAQLYPGQAQPPVEAESVTPAPAQPQPAEEPSQPPAEPTTNVVELPRAAEPAAPAPAAPAPAQPEPPERDAAYWRQRFETVQGKLNTEMPSLYQQLRAKEQELEALRRQPAPAQPAQPAAPASIPATGQLVTESDVEAFGGNLTDFVLRVARGVGEGLVSQALADLRKEFGTVQEQLGQVSSTVVKSELDRFWDSVIALIPDWKSVDADPAWIAFLDTAPEFSSHTYRQLAADAVQKRMPDKIASLVKAWRGAAVSQPAPAPQPSPAPQQPRPAPELQRQVAPSTSRSSAPVQPAARIWTQADYAEAYDVRNVARYGQQKANEMIAEADRAVAEGRVRW